MKLALYSSLALLILFNGLAYSDADKPAENYEIVYRYQPEDVLSIRDGEWKGYVVYVRRVSEQTEKLEAATRKTQTIYQLDDLPFWSKGGKVFDATLLMSVLQSNIEPDSWGKHFTITCKGSSLAVTATAECHLEVDRFLDRFRSKP